MNIYTDLIKSTPEEIQYIANNKYKYYLSFPIRKSSGKKRWLHAPQEPLKTIQKNILKNILSEFGAHPCAYGFVKNRNVRMGAKLHRKAEVMLCLDIKNFFPSIKTLKVIKLLTYLLKSKYNLNNTDLKYLTELVTFNGALPQGAPTSPALANLYCLSMDKTLLNMAKTHNVRYTRYADDMCFSSKNKIFDFKTTLMPLIKQTLKANSLHLNYKKTRTLRQNRRMEITGVVVNDKLSVNRTMRRNLRAQLHNYIVNNIAITAKEFDELQGKIAWIKSINFKHGQTLMDQLGKVIII